MTTSLIILIWCGGIGPAYKAYRRKAGRLTSFGEACFWPWDLGKVLAQLVYKAYIP